VVGVAKVKGATGGPARLIALVWFDSLFRRCGNHRREQSAKLIAGSNITDRAVTLDRFSTIGDRWYMELEKAETDRREW